MSENNTINHVLNNELVKNVYEESIKHKIPILRDKTVELLLDIIDENKIKTCLEIGSGVGYSSCIINQIKNVTVTTIEKDPIRFNNLVNNLKTTNIKCINDDCFNFDTNDKFDLIIIDGPKKNQIKLIEKFQKNLNDNGLMFIDNVFLKAYRELTNLTNNQKKTLIHIDELQTYLKNLDNKCKIYNIDDGVAIIKK